IGSWIGQLLPLSAFERKVLLASGAAAGMTVIFGTPLAAILLAIELLLFEYRAQSFLPVTLGSVLAATLRAVFWSNEPFFLIPATSAPSAVAIGIYILSGLVFGVLAVLITR